MQAHVDDFAVNELLVLKFGLVKHVDSGAISYA